MNIALNTLALHKTKAGMGNYIVQLCTNLPKLFPAHNYTVYISNTNKHFFSELQDLQHVTLVPVPAVFAGPWSKVFWEQLVLPFSLFGRNIQVYHALGFTQSLLAFLFSRLQKLFSRDPLRLIVTIADMTFRNQPQYHTFAKRRYFSMMIPLAAIFSDHVITISQHTRNDLLATVAVPAEKVHAIPLAAANCFKIIDRKKASSLMRIKYHLSSPFILFVGVLEPRKNVQGLINAFTALKRQRKFTGYKLVLAGKQGWHYNTIASCLANCPYRSDIIMLGYVPDEDLVHLYNTAAVFVYPSFYEGFGIPVLEAMACGCPVITSKHSSLQEIASVENNATHFIDPCSQNDLVAGLENVLTDQHYRLQLQKQGKKNAAHFNWKKTTEMTMQVYQKSMETGQEL